MSAFQDISDKDFDQLVGESPTTLAFHDPDRPNAKVKFCSVCGACGTPEKCPAAYQCPTCFALPTELCREIDGYHKERIDYARSNKR